MAENVEQEQLAGTVNNALRGPKYGIFEQLICQHLIQATTSPDSLRKVQNICDAALMIDAEKQKTLGLDMEKVNVLKVVCDALDHKVSTNLKDHTRPLVTVEFGFEYTEENFKKFITPWNPPLFPSHFSAYIRGKNGKSYRYWVCANCNNPVGDSIRGKFGFDDNEKCKICGANLCQHRFDNPFPYHSYVSFEWNAEATNTERFFAVCEVLSSDGYIALETSFLSWAMPLAMDLMRRLTEAVRPEIYREIAKMFIKTKKEAEN